MSTRPGITRYRCNIGTPSLNEVVRVVSGLNWWAVPDDPTAAPAPIGKSLAPIFDTRESFQGADPGFIAELVLINQLLMYTRVVIVIPVMGK